MKLNHLTKFRVYVESFEVSEPFTMKPGQFMKPDIHVEAWTVYQASYSFFLSYFYFRQYGKSIP
jgi:hypothetical protein